MAAWFVLRDHYRLRLRTATGWLLLALGTPLVVLGALIAALGLERAMTWWNDQLALLPWGLHRILGLTVYLGIPTVLPLLAAIVGAIAVLIGALLVSRSGRRRGSGSEPATTPA